MATNYATSPFLGGNNGGLIGPMQPKPITTGGSTTPLIQGAYRTGTAPAANPWASPTPIMTPTPTTANLSLGAKAVSPTTNVTQPSATLPTNQVDKTYFLQPGESLAAYNARIAQYNASKSSTSSPTAPTPSPTPAPSPTPTPTPAPAPATPATNPNANPYTAAAPTYGGLIGSLATTASQPSQAFLDAQKQAQQALQDLQTSRTNEAQALSANAQNPIPLEFQQGRGQVIQNQYLQQQNAYANTYQGATAQEQAATGQQGTQQQGLGAAAGYAAPIPGQALGYVNPATMQSTPYGGTGGSGISGAAQVLGNLSTGQNFYSSLLPAYNQAQSVLGSEGQNGQPGTGLMGFLQQNPDLNPVSLNAGNFVNQWVNNQFSNPKYTQLGQYLNELLQTLTPIVGSQGVSDYKSQLVQSMVNPTASTQSIRDQIQNLMNIATGKMKATQQTFTGQAPFNATSPASSPTPSGSNFYSSNWFSSQ